MQPNATHITDSLSSTGCARHISSGQGNSRQITHFNNLEISFPAFSRVIHITLLGTTRG